MNSQREKLSPPSSLVKEEKDCEGDVLRSIFSKDNILCFTITMCTLFILGFIVSAIKLQSLEKANSRAIAKVMVTSADSIMTQPAVPSSSREIIDLQAEINEKATLVSGICTDASESGKSSLTAMCWQEAATLCKTAKVFEILVTEAKTEEKRFRTGSVADYLFRACLPVCMLSNFSYPPDLTVDNHQCDRLYHNAEQYPK